MKINGFRKIYEVRNCELRIGPNDERFSIIEVATSIFPKNKNDNWANDHTMWIRPIDGWQQTEVFGIWIPVCKIDWERKYINIAISRAGAGPIVDHILGAHPFEHKDVMDISYFKKFLSKVLGNCNINQYK